MPADMEEVVMTEYKRIIPHFTLKEEKAVLTGDIVCEDMVGLYRAYSDNGADEIYMVINIGALKAGDYTYVQNEIEELKKTCKDKVLKVIIETCLLTEEEKVKMCEIVTNAKADFIKTSTGFSSAGATFEDVALFAAHVGPNVKIKAAGGISSFEDAEKFISLGADRLGTSRLVKIEKSL